MAHAREGGLGAHVIASTWRLMLVRDDGEVLLARRWLDVATGGWEPVTRTLSVVWVDGSRPAEWSFPDSTRLRLAEVFRERVTTSVVLGAPLEDDGREFGRAAIRRDIETGRLVPQIAWSRGRPSTSPQRQARAREVLAVLAERVGLEGTPEV